MIAVQQHVQQLVRVLESRREMFEPSSAAGASAGAGASVGADAADGGAGAVGAAAGGQAHQAWARYQQELAKARAMLQSVSAGGLLGLSGSVWSLCESVFNCMHPSLEPACSQHQQRFSASCLHFH